MSSEPSGLVFDIKRFALHDGPGIRTTAFLKGCPLSCIWCQNPEGISPKPLLWYHSEKCIRCEACIAACPESALSARPEERQFVHIDRQACTLNGACVNVCPSGALTWDSRRYTVGELVDDLEKDRVFYRNSEGGITLSGGEPLFQLDFAIAVLAEAKRRELHTTIESTLFLNQQALEQVLPLMDHLLTDIKLLDPAEHRRYTGVDNTRILENIRFLAGRKTSMTIRIPLIPEISATDANVAATAAFVASLPGDVPLELVNFNPLPVGKYTVLGLDWPFQQYTSPFPQEDMHHFADVARQEGARLVEE